MDVTIAEADGVEVTHEDEDGEIINPESLCVTTVAKKAIEIPTVLNQQSPNHELLGDISKTVISDPFQTSLKDIPLPDCKKDLDHYQFLLTVQNQLIANEFSVTHSIHSLPAIDFYRRILKAPDFVLEILRFGYKPEFNSELVLPYFEKNNSSALKEMDYVRYCFSFI